MDGIGDLGKSFIDVVDYAVHWALPNRILIFKGERDNHNKLINEKKN